MQYLGGKHSLAKKIAAYLESVRPDGAPFFDVFAGGLNITAAMSGTRIANDACEPLITLYRAWSEGWRPPPEISEDEYYWIQACGDSTDPITAFAGFGVSYGGKFFAGYARSNGSKKNPKPEGVNFAGTAARSLDRKLRACRGVRFECQDFEDLIIPDGALVSLDPPYRGTTAYGFFGAFDHDRFDRWALELARRCVVVRSEYQAPDPWVDVESFPISGGRLQIQREKLFMIRDQHV